MSAYRPPEDRIDAVPPQAAIERVPVVVVTGYLGAGKTTSISSLLHRPDMAGTAVIVNELAEAGIDQSIIADAGADEVVVLSNGCLCCAGGSDLRNSVARLLRRRDAAGGLKRILVETSGAADPGPILKQICFDPALRSAVRYSGVVTLFDAQNGQDLLARDPVGFRQIALADQIVLTKTDLVGPRQAAAARAFLQALIPAVPVSETADALPAFVREAGRGVVALGAARWLGETAATEIHRAHRQMLSTWSIFAEQPIGWERAEPALQCIFDRHGDNILRTKGLLWTENDDRPLVIHGINRHFHRPVRLSGWDAEPSSRFVVIGFASAAPAVAAIAEAIGGTCQ